MEDEELQKLLDTGEITPKDAENLRQLTPGNYCLHKSWGFGKIAEWNLGGNQVVIDFEDKKGHSMQAKYAANSLEPLAEDHVLVWRTNDPEAFKAQAKEEPVEVMKKILANHGSRMFADDIADLLKPRVFDEKEYKRWWDSTKKLLKKDGHFIVPPKKTSPIELRDKPLSRSEELIKQFKDARQPKQMLKTVEEILKNRDEFTDPVYQLQPVTASLETSAGQQQNLRPEVALDFLVARDSLVEEFKELKKGTETLEVADVLKGNEEKLGELIPQLPAARQRRALGAFPEAFGDNWSHKLMDLVPQCPSRTVADVYRILRDAKKEQELFEYLRHAIQANTATSEMLYWFCKERTRMPAEMIGPNVLKCVLSALEYDQLSETKKGTKLQNLIFDDLELIPDMLEGAERREAGELLRRLKMSPAFDDLTKRSFLGRIIKLHPELQSVLTGEEGEKEESLIVSWESLDARRAEFKKLVEKEIPQNSKEISAARELGDLRENFEYKAAKQQQAVLLRRKAELEDMIGKAQGTDFKNPDTGKVSIGTTVAFKDVDDGTEETYHILGAWDSDPKNQIIAYKTAIGMALLGRAVGETVELPTEYGQSREVEVLSIDPYIES
jgi:transcription elongation GreA/GreB family factor